MTGAEPKLEKLGRDLQMVAQPRVRDTTLKRQALWNFQTLDTLRIAWRNGLVGSLGSVMS